MHLTAFCKPLLPPEKFHSKTGRMMKLVTLFLFAACIQVSARSYSQGITLSLDNVPLSAVFTAIQQQSHFYFVYTSEELKGASRISLKVKNQSIERVLETCFRGQPLSYTIRDQYILVTEKEKTNEAKPDSGQWVTGMVVNDKYQPVAGASIGLRGTRQGTASDAKGAFALNDVPAGAVLVISSIGYETREMLIGNNRYLTIQLLSAVSGLDELFVKGYYSTSQRLNTGSVAKINAEQIAEQPVTNPLAALEGRMPGVFIQQTTGMPGGAINIQIRGQNSLRNSVADNGNLPLYIIDGVPFTATSLLSTTISGSNLKFGSPLSSLNPADIESMEVLKDADATAIYGSRGSNGVVLITTKKGTAGKAAFNLSCYTGAGRVTRVMDLMDTPAYLQMRHEAFRNDNATPGVTAYDLNGAWDTTRHTDWQKELIGGTAHLSNAQASLSGGSLTDQYLVSAGYSRESTVTPGNLADQKGSVLLNLHHQSENKKLNLGISANYVTDDDHLLSLDFTSLTRLSPDAPALYNADGSLNWQGSTWTNPLSNLQKKYNNSTANLISNASLSYQLLPGLKFRTSMGYNNIRTKEISINPLSSVDPAFISTSKGSAFFADSYLKSWILEPQLDYLRTGRHGKLDLLVGATLQDNERQSQTLSAKGYTSDALISSIQAAPTVTVAAYSFTQYRYNALFARLNYEYAQQFILNLTGRRDGSSRFGPDKQFANFGAVGAAWIFSKLALFQQPSILSYGKLRASYGITGNDNIADYGYLDAYTTTTYAYNGIAGLVPSRLPNADYSWETNKKLEAALELGFIKDRLLFTLAYYRNRSSNQLVGYPLAGITGFTSVQYNLPATVQNTGWELSASGTIVKAGKFSWAMDINASLPRNKLIAYPNLAGSSYASTYTVGKSLYTKNLFHYTGVDLQSGLYTYEDKDKDGKLTTPNDLQPLKQVAVDYYGGFQNSFHYGNFQLDVFLQFVKQSGYNYLYSIGLPGSLVNQPADLINRWQHPGDMAKAQQYTQSFSSAAYTAFSNMQFYGDNTISDASFVRLKTLSFSYRLPANSLSRLHLRNCRFFVQGQNLFTFTHYLGYDPENQATINLPPLKVLTGGFQITL